MAEGRDYPVEYAVNLSLDNNDDEEEYEDFDEAALVEELKQRLQRYTLPGLGHTSFQQLNAKAAIAAAHHRAYIQVGIVRTDVGSSPLRLSFFFKNCGSWTVSCDFACTIRKH